MKSARSANKKNKSESRAKLKERKRSESGFVRSLFESNKKALPAIVKTPSRTRAELSRTSGSMLKSPLDVTSPSKLQSQARSKARSKSKVRSREGSRQSNTPRLALALLLIGFIGYGLSEWHREAPSEDSQEVALDPEAARAAEEALRDRVNFHRNLIGGKLNRDRIGVDVENQVTSGTLPVLSKSVKEPDVMSGLPLVPEPHHRTTSRDRIEPPNPDYADVNVRYSLREQQAANDWEEQARQQYVNEFIANAARAGYQVRVDSNGVVTVIGRTGNVEAGRLPSDDSFRGLAR